jgi:uncharacterized protein YraI
MRLSRLSTLAAAATIMLLAGSAAASAASAYASSTVNVRAGAGTGYPVVGVLRRGERVDIDYCRGAWCLIETRRGDGWVNANYLNQRNTYRRERYDDRYDYYDDYDDGFYITRPGPLPYPYYRSEACIGGSNASFCISN